MQYAQDYDEMLPMLYDHGNPRNGLIQTTQPYTKNYQVHDCPSADMLSSRTHYLGSMSYGYNPYLINADVAAKLGNINRPAEVVLLSDVLQDSNAPGRKLNAESFGAMQTDYDGSNCKICGSKHNSLFPNHGAAQRPGFNVIERHNGTANCGFADGHAKAMKHTTLYNGGNDSPYLDPA